MFKTKRMQIFNYNAIFKAKLITYLADANRRKISLIDQKLLEYESRNLYNAKRFAAKFIIGGHRFLDSKKQHTRSQKSRMLFVY